MGELEMMVTSDMRARSHFLARKGIDETVSLNARSTTSYSWPESERAIRALLTGERGETNLVAETMFDTADTCLVYWARALEITREAHEFNVVCRTPDGFRSFLVMLKNIPVNLHVIGDSAWMPTVMSPPNVDTFYVEGEVFTYIRTAATYVSIAQTSIRTFTVDRATQSVSVRDCPELRYLRGTPVALSIIGCPMTRGYNVGRRCVLFRTDSPGLYSGGARTMRVVGARGTVAVPPTTEVFELESYFRGVTVVGKLRSCTVGDCLDIGRGHAVDIWMGRARDHRGAAFPGCTAVAVNTSDRVRLHGAESVILSGRTNVVSDVDPRWSFYYRPLPGGGTVSRETDARGRVTVLYIDADMAGADILPCDSLQLVRCSGVSLPLTGYRDVTATDCTLADNDTLRLLFMAGEGSMIEASVGGILGASRGAPGYEFVGSRTHFTCAEKIGSSLYTVNNCETSYARECVLTIDAGSLMGLVNVHDL